MDEIAKGDAPELRMRDEVEAWLKGKPRVWSVAFAARAAMRVLPLASQARSDGLHVFLQLTSATFRCSAIAWVAAKNPTRPVEGAAIAADAAYHAASTSAATAYAFTARGAAAAALVAAYATDATSARDAHARAAATTAYAFISAAGGASWTELLQDRRFLDNTGTTRALTAQPLWNFDSPKWAAVAWSDLRAALPEGEHWEVWIDWYEARLKKSRWNKKKELIYASVPLDVWEKGHVAANTWIYGELEKQKRPKKHNDERKNDDDRALVEQSPAPTSFRIVGETIDAAPESAGAIDETIAAAFYDEVKRKLRELRKRLERAQADKRLQGNLALLEARLGASLADVSVGHLLPSLYSLERDFEVYNSEDGRKEHPLDLIAALGDAAGSVRDLVALFPKVRQIEAEALALRIVQRPEIQEEIAEQGRKAIAAASDSPHVTPAAESALRDTEKSVATARDADERARQLSYLALDLANFARAGIVLGAKEVGGFAGDCWREIRSRVPSRIGKLAALGVTLYGLSTLADNLLLEKIKLLRELGGVVERLGKLIEDKPPPKASDKPSVQEQSEVGSRRRHDSLATEKAARQSNSSSPKPRKRKR